MSSRWRDLAWFALWASIGGLFALTLLGALTIGVFVLLVPVMATLVLRRIPNAVAGRPGIITGAAIPVFYVAFLNRHGPGNICNSNHFHCHDEWNPWPWLLAGIGVAVTGAVVFTRARRP
jgi:hypothetical protein